MSGHGLCQAKRDLALGNVHILGWHSLRWLSFLIQRCLWRLVMQAASWDATTSPIVAAEQNQALSDAFICWLVIAEVLTWDNTHAYEIIDAHVIAAARQPCCCTAQGVLELQRYWAAGMLGSILDICKAHGILSAYCSSTEASAPLLRLLRQSCDLLEDCKSLPARINTWTQCSKPAGRTQLLLWQPM